MIESSFCFLPGVGVQTERQFWSAGLVTWEAFLTTHSLRHVSGIRKARFDEEITQARDHFARRDVRYFARTVPARYQWRLYEWLRPGAVYLDIETNSFGEITVVGLYGHGAYTALLRGESLDWHRLTEELSHYDLLVTFCGRVSISPCSPRIFPR